MADLADIANEDPVQEALQVQKEMAIRRLAQLVPEGKAGQCEYCERQVPRIVNGACAVCREKYRI